MAISCLFPSLNIKSSVTTDSFMWKQRTADHQDYQKKEEKTYATT